MSAERETVDEVIADCADRPLTEEQQDAMFRRLDIAASESGDHPEAGPENAAAARLMRLPRDRRT